MPKIGMRIFKSSAAVFLCFVIYLIRGEGIPFYSAIAAVLTMQPYVSNSRKVAFNRTVGTLIGGLFGMLVMVIQKNLAPLHMPVLNYLLVSVVIIPLIYVTVLIKKTTASYITCVVFMSITVSHGLDASPYWFALNRILDTLIGIFVSLCVNMFHLPRRKNERLLFVSDLCGTLTDAQGKISSYTRIRLNQLIQQGALIAVASGHSPASVESMIRGINLRLPVITLNGAALYDRNTKTYLSCKTIPYADAKEILSVFHQYGLNCFVHTIVNDILHIYYGDFTNPAEENMYHAHKLLPLKNYIYSSLPEDRDVVFFQALDTPETVKRLQKEVLSLPCGGRIQAEIYPDAQNDGYRFLEIFSAEASKAGAVAELKQLVSAEQVAAFGCDRRDLSMIRQADYGCAVENAEEEIKAAADTVIGGWEQNAVVRTMEKLYHSRKLDCRAARKA